MWVSRCKGWSSPTLSCLRSQLSGSCRSRAQQRKRGKEYPASGHSVEESSRDIVALTQMRVAVLPSRNKVTDWARTALAGTLLPTRCRDNGGYPHECERLMAVGLSCDGAQPHVGGPAPGGTRELWGGPCIGQIAGGGLQKAQCGGGGSMCTRHWSSEDHVQRQTNKHKTKQAQQI